MKPKFTQGPWGFAGTDICDISSDQHLVAKIQGNATYLGPKNRVEVVANALLIATAPEMYEALETVLLEVRGLPESVESQIFAVLKKARGEI
jgi:hypothetical protein